MVFIPEILASKLGMQPKKHFNSFVWKLSFWEIELLPFQKSPYHHQRYYAYPNDCCNLRLMYYFLYLTWNIILLQHFLVFYVEFLFSLHFFCAHWSCFAHQISLYTCIRFFFQMYLHQPLEFLFFLVFFFFQLSWGFWVNS